MPELAPIAGENEITLMRKLVVSAGGTLEAWENEITLWKKFVTANGGAVISGDNKLTLLKKAVTAKGGVTIAGDSEITLTRKLAAIMGGDPGVGGNEITLLRGIVIAANSGSAPVNAVAPVIDNATPQTGDTIHISDGAWTNSPTSFLYRWFSNGSLQAESSNSYTVTESPGAEITASVAAVNTVGSSGYVQSPVHGIVASPVGGGWILATGFWNDSAAWDDAAIWID